jgi:hypothetical protein
LKFFPYIAGRNSIFIPSAGEGTKIYFPLPWREGMQGRGRILRVFCEKCFPLDDAHTLHGFLIEIEDF